MIFFLICLRNLHCSCHNPNSCHLLFLSWGKCRSSVVKQICIAKPGELWANTCNKPSWK